MSLQACGSGYVPETLGEGCGGVPGPLDRPEDECGSRKMGDTSPVFVLRYLLYLLYWYKSTNTDT